MKPINIIKNNSKVKAKWRVVLLCVDCKISKECSYKYYQLIRHKDVYRCIKCAVNINRDKISENMKEKWKDTTYRELITDKINKYMETEKALNAREDRHFKYFRDSIKKELDNNFLDGLKRG